jgi:photosystem II stability/assembly factor-like uncharacterized protein
MTTPVFRRWPPAVSRPDAQHKTQRQKEIQVVKCSRTSCFKAVAGALLLAVATTATGFKDPVLEPAFKSDLVFKSPLLATVSVGERVIGVGVRGHIVLSADAGKTWTQADSPVSSDLLAVSFPTASQGWAVGHGGVVIHSADGGATWQRQLVGKEASDIAIKYYDERAKAGNAEAAGFLEKENSLAGAGGTQPFMDVFFEDESSGYVVGTFNRIFHTADGGKTWEPVMHQVDNPDEFHFYSIRGGSSIHLTGEQGRVWALDKAGAGAAGRFVAHPTGYDGTLFGSVQAGDGSLIAYGMRGSVYRSDDQGKSWSRVDLGNAAGINTGARLANGDVVLASLSGTVALSHDGGRTFKPLKTSRPMSYFGVTAVDGNRLIFVGAEGVRVETMN